MIRPFVPARARHTYRPDLETLEDRLVPSTMAGCYADGTWRYDTTAGWAHISNQTAYRLAVDDSGNVYGDYSNGMWRWDAVTTGWQKLSDLVASQIDTTSSGVLYCDFDKAGLWRWSFAGWQKLSDLDVFSFAVSRNDSFLGRFDEAGAAGTWRWTPTQGWSLLTGNRPDYWVTDAAGDLVGTFKTYIPAGQAGTWRWSPTAGWAHLSTASARISVSDNGTIFEARGVSGLWRALPGAVSFTQIDQTDTTNDFLFALPDGTLYDHHWTGAVSQGSLVFAGWYFNGSLWGQVINDTTIIFPNAIGKDGDLFFDSGASGTGYWSLQSPYHTLAGNAQDPQLVLVSQR
jgi:hypothetical protein